LKTNLLPALSAIGILAAIFSNPAAHADSYTDGVKSYGAHNYAQARKFFEAAAAANPNNWLVHYQLGNTYLALSQKELARQAYEKARDCNPPAAYKGNIEKAMSYLGVPLGDKKAAVKAVSKNKGDEEADDKADKGKTGKTAEKTEKEDPVKAKIEARKKQIIADAEKEVARIKADRKKKRDEEGQGKWYRTTEGEVKQGFSKDEDTEYNNETDRMIAKVMDDAKRKADSVLSP
jgi:tetratricopeptide (TPR) repeat protein